MDEQRHLLKKAYEQLKRSYDNLSKPTGEKSSPAKSCNELAMARPELTSGDYWIDPNEGDKKDAILVHCDMPKRATCVRSQPMRSNNIQYAGDEEEIWLSEAHNGMKLTYKAHSSQLAHLQMLSTHASQNVTYHCKQSVGYFDAKENHHRHAIKLLAWNDAVLTARNSQHLRYEVTEDGCKVIIHITIYIFFQFSLSFFGLSNFHFILFQSRSNQWSKTEISYHTEKPSRLPIADVAVRDIGEEGQEFAIEVSWVCFQTQEFSPL